MNKIIFLLVCCVLICACWAQNQQNSGGNWRRKWGSKSAKWRNAKRKWSMKNYTNAKWTTVINGIEVTESAKYRNGRDVVFIKSYDNTLQDPSIGYNTSFQVYDVANALGAVVVGHGQFCFITKMDQTATMETVKAELDMLNNTESTIPKPIVELNVLNTNAVKVQDLLKKSFMISAICSRAATCDRAFLVEEEQQITGDIQQVWRTSGLYNRYAINMAFNPEEEKQCRAWQNYWMRKNRRQWRRT